MGWGAGRMGNIVRARGLGLLSRHVPHRLKGSRNPETSTEHAAEVVPRLYKRCTEVDCTGEGGMEGAVAPPVSPIPFHVTCPPETHLSIPAAQATEHFHSMPRKRLRGSCNPSVTPHIPPFPPQHTSLYPLHRPGTASAASPIQATGQWHPLCHFLQTTSYTTTRITTPNPTDWGPLSQHAPYRLQGARNLTITLASLDAPPSETNRTQPHRLGTASAACPV